MGNPLSRVQHQGETQIPKRVREFLGLKEGDYVSWTMSQPGLVLLRKAKISE